MTSTRIAVLMCLGMVGCGDKTPQEQCEDLVSLVCDRALECIPGTEGRHDECFASLRRSAGCERVRSHSLTYDTCMISLEARSCAALFGDSTSTRITATVPAECSTAVDLMPSSGEAARGAWDSSPPSARLTTSAGAR